MTSICVRKWDCVIIQNADPESVRQGDGIDTIGYKSFKGTKSEYADFGFSPSENKDATLTFIDRGEFRKLTYMNCETQHLL